MKWWIQGMICLSGWANVAAQEEGFLFRIYEARTGQQISVSALIDSLMHYDIIFVGEEHDNPICHWLQLQIIQGIYRRDSAVDVGRGVMPALWPDMACAYSTRSPIGPMPIWLPCPSRTIRCNPAMPKCSKGIWDTLWASKSSRPKH